MIIARICGGLGNQLFIYAAARAFARKRGVEYCLALPRGATFDEKYGRNFLLAELNLPYTLANDRDAYRDSLGAIRERVDRARFKWRIFPRRDFISETKRCFVPGILEPVSGRPVFLSGYWQSDRYFTDLRSQLNDEVSTASVPEGSRRLMARLGNPDPASLVSVHVRSYGELPSDRRAELLVGSDYYRKAIAELERAAGRSLRVLCFSDDNAYARHVMAFTSTAEFLTTELGEVPLDTLTTFWLMRQCAHHVIAASTFSWWAAWLKAPSYGKVIAPRVIATLNQDIFASDWAVF